MATNVMIVESEMLVGSLIAEWVRSRDDLRLLAVHSSVAAARTTQAEWVDEVDLLVCSLDIGGDDGVALAADVTRVAKRPVPVVVIASRATIDDATRLRNMVTTGWALISRTHNAVQHLRQAVDAAVAGLVMIDPVFAAAVPGTAAGAPLTPQERAVLAMLARGMSNQAIASEQFLSIKSVERVIRSIYDKLGVSHRAKDLNPRVLATLRYFDLS